MSKIPFAHGLALPLDAVTQTFAFLARRGAGKSYSAMKLAEGFLDERAQVVVLDPVGVWYGLRLAPNGRGHAFNIPVLGGEHGDIPLEPAGGALVARAIVESGTSVILDVSHFRKNQRKQFCTDFAEELFQLKKTHRTPMHFFVEEAQTFCPQKTFHGEERMLGAFEDIIKLGRNYGIGATLISQRPQAVNKDVLNQTECLVVLQTNGAQERAALKLWMQANGVDLTNVLDELPNLARGEAYVWSPSWLRVFKRVKIDVRSTFDASATPEVGKRAVERQLAPIDLAKLEMAMKDSVERAKADDPKALRKRVAELEAQLRTAGEKAVVKTVVEKVIDKTDLARLERAIDKLHKYRDATAQAEQVVASTLGNIATVLRQQAQPKPLPKTETGRTRTDIPNISNPPRPASDLSKLDQAILDGLAWYSAIGIVRVSRAALAAIVGRKQGGHFNNTVGGLRSAGLVDYPVGDHVSLTPTGEMLAQAPEERPTLRALHESVLGVLSGLQKTILEKLIEHYPDSIPRAELATMLDRQEGGHFNNMVGSLRTMGLVEYPSGGLVKASTVLFPQELA